MTQKKGFRSYLITVGGAVVVFVLVAAFLGGLRSTTEVVVARAAIPAGARLTASYVELREVHSSDALPGALTALEDAQGQVLTIARAPGDQITAEMVGDAATVGLSNQLQPGHRAVAVHVDQASGLLGVLRPGDRVSVVAVVDPQAAQMSQATRTYNAPVATDGEVEEQATPVAPAYDPAPAAYVTLSGLRVLLVPQLFRYEEALPEEEDGGFAPVRTTASAQRDGVILLDVPLAPVPVARVGETAGVEVEASPAALLPLLDAHAKLHLLLEPVKSDGVRISVGAELGDLYRAMVGWAEPLTATVASEAAAPGSTTAATAATTGGED